MLNLIVRCVGEKCLRVRDFMQLPIEIIVLESFFTITMV